MKPLLIMTLASVAFSAQAQINLPAGTFREAPAERFITSQNAYYKNPQMAMKNRVIADKQNKKVNKFCLIGL